MIFLIIIVNIYKKGAYIHVNNLAKYRSLKGLTQAQMAEQLGTSKANLCFFEKNRLSFKSAEKCAAVLDVNVFELLGSDSLVAIPKTEEDKAILIDIIKKL